MLCIWMARIARIVIPGLPHHITQRGNRRAQVFLDDSDYALYRDLVFDAAERAQCEIWAWCLMPNHTHLIVVPSDEDGLRRTFGDAHRRYTGYINARLRVTGHLWQSRFGSTVMDEPHFYEAVRYVSLNPVRAGLVERARDWAWSSVRDHLAGRDDRSFKAGPVLTRVGDFGKYLAEPFNEVEAFQKLRASELTGRPAAGVDWMEKMEQKTGKSMLPRKRGRKPKNIGESNGAN
jgi:putative transposase